MSEIYYRRVCAECGSEEIEFNGSGYWNITEGKIDWCWDDTYCHTCGDLVDTVDKRIPIIPSNTYLL